MQFKYVGEEKSIVAFGIEFPKGKPVEVKDEFVAKKLAGNPFFEAVTKEQK